MAGSERQPAASHDTVEPTTVEIVPLTPDRWDDVAALFGEGGDPKTCWCMFWRLRSKDWSFANTSETREGLHRLVDEGRDPAPGLLAYEDGRAVGWVSVGPREDYARLVHSKVRPAIDDQPVWSIVCFVVSKTARGRGLTTRLLDAAMDYARAHGAPALEAYPVDPGEGRVPAALGYTGLLSTPSIRPRRPSAGSSSAATPETGRLWSAPRTKRRPDNGAGAQIGRFASLRALPGPADGPGVVGRVRSAVPAVAWSGRETAGRDAPSVPRRPGGPIR